MSRKSKRESNGEILDTTALPSLPDGWCWTPLGSLLTKSQNGFGKRRQSKGQPAIVLRLADIQDGRVSLTDTRQVNATEKDLAQYALQEDDVIAIRVNGSPNLVGRLIRFTGADEPILFCDHFIQLRFTITELAHYIRLIGDTLLVRHFVDENKVSSAGQNTISQSTLERLQVPLAPLNEQRRIVEKIEELFSDLDAGVAALRRAKANLKRYRASVLKAAVDGSLTAEWRRQHPAVEPAQKLLARILKERRRRWEESQLAKFAAADREPPKNWKLKYVEPAPPDTTNLPTLPEGWCWARLDQLLVYLRNGYFQSPSRAETGTPILRINAVRPLSVDLTEVRFLDDIKGTVDGYFVENGDLLFTRYNGSVDLLGVAGMVRGCTENVLHPDKLIRVQLAIADPFPSFVEIAANIGVSRKHMVARARTTAGQTGISGTDVREMPISLPPLDEQAKIVTDVAEKLSQIEAANKAIDHSLQRAARLRQSILKQAFEGKLVAQDPADEPASVLLGRRQSASGNNSQRKPI